MGEVQVYLKKQKNGELVEATLFDEVTDQHLKLWEESWGPVMKAHCAGRNLEDKPEDHHWNWTAKANGWRPLLGYHSFAIVCEGQLQGLMLASDFKSARLPVQFGRSIVFVEFLATAPWNRPSIQKPPQFGGVGTVMVGEAVTLSFEADFKGRIGLHSLPEAESFYKNKCGMSALGKDAAHQNLMYFEMTEKQADCFRR